VYGDTDGAAIGSLGTRIESSAQGNRNGFPGVKLTPNAPLVVGRDDRLKRGGIHYLVERSYRAAGLANRVPAGAVVHALRHTFATRIAEDRATATEIQALLGTSRWFSSAATHGTCDDGPFGLPHRSGARAGTDRRLGGAARPRR
jgi:hypothetical protein